MHESSIFSTAKAPQLTSMKAGYTVVTIRHEELTNLTESAKSLIGMAVQLSSDLGLHLDLEYDRSLLEPSHSDLETTQILKNLFWTVNSLDRYENFLLPTMHVSYPFQTPFTPFLPLR